jgi:hypothetical protein
MGVYKAEDITAPFCRHLPSSARTFPARGSSRLGLNHPNVCTIYEIGPQGNQPFIAMDFF